MWRRGHGRGKNNFKRDHRQSWRNKTFARDTNKIKNETNKYSDDLVEKLNENDVGITEYVSNLEGFIGILKSRFSDFHVNEIDKDGKIAKLTDLKVPDESQLNCEEEDDDLLVNRYRIEQLPIETWDRIHKMIQTKNKYEIVEIDVTEMTKDDRTKIHEALKTVFGRKIVGSTVTRKEKKFVVVRLYNRKARSIDRRQKWPSFRNGEYLHFLVYKEGIDTIEANIRISSALQTKSSHFTYAGVKDRRAKTTQWFSARKFEALQVSNRTKYLRNIKVGNFCYKKNNLKLGDLKGNRFRIALRNIKESDEKLVENLESLKENGFINYYGLQRFGNSKDVPTHQIGIELLKGNWKEAVYLILKPRKLEQDKFIGEAKQIFMETRDVEQSLEKLGSKKHTCIEGKLLLGMLKHSSNDFVNSLEKVPRNMRLLYIHAYQSLVWNQIVSKRIKELGFKPIVGDLVVDGEVEEDLQLLENNDEDLSKESTSPSRLKVKTITEEDLDKYTIFDIVLPLPGFDIIYPENVVKDWYREILEKDGLKLEMPKQKVRTYTLSGAYRKVLVKVTNFSWKILGYNDPIANLIQSDYEELLGEPEPENITDAKYKALILDFCLPASSYATMSLRELMKMDTNVNTHINLNQEHNKELQTATTNIESTENAEINVNCQTKDQKTIDTSQTVDEQLLNKNTIVETYPNNKINIETNFESSEETIENNVEEKNIAIDKAVINKSQDSAIKVENVTVDDKAENNKEADLNLKRKIEMDENCEKKIKKEDN